MRELTLVCAAALLGICSGHAQVLFAGQENDSRGLVAYWKLQGDCKDHSGNGKHGVNRGVNLDTGEFNGKDAYIEVPNSDSLNLGTGDFSISAWVYTEKDLDDVIGDVLSKYDPAKRKGFTFNIKASSGGYQSQGSDKHVYFGIDNGNVSDWEDCGRPNATSNYVSNSLTVFRGKLYAATTDAKKQEDWCRVYCYEGGQKWTDCGRVGDRKTTGVMSLIVHDGKLYAATCTYDWTRVVKGDYDPGRVYCYEGGKQWKDCGQPSDNRRLICMASFKGKLYVGGGNETRGVFVYQGGKQWQASKIFPAKGPGAAFPHSMGMHDGKLYVGFPAFVHSFDGKKWEYVGIPVEGCTQVHSLEPYQGRLYAGTWRKGEVGMYQDGEQWKYCGRLGKDSTEINALTVYNGKLYGGSIPRAEITRYEGGTQWTVMKTFLSPQGWEPVAVGAGGPDYRKGVNDWTRVTSLTVYNGRLFASIGSCTSSILDAPADVRGKVFSMEAGKCVSYDDDLGSGWKHIAAIREKGQLKLYVNGKLAATSSPFNPEDYDISNNQPLTIGFGEMDYFSGKIKEVRLYNRGLNESEVKSLQQKHLMRPSRASRGS